MTEDERIKMLETTLARLLQWIAAAESRIALVLSLDTAMLGATALFAPSPKVWTTITAVAGALALVALVLSFISLALATFPRTDGPKQSLVYFGGISERDGPQFLNDTQALTKQNYIEDLASQCHRNGVIASKKFAYVRRAQIALFCEVAPWVATLFLIYQQRQ